MSRKIGLLLTLAVFAASPLFAQDWAKKMFKDSDHDFGTCARNARAEYEFVFENLYMEDVHVSGVRSSCGCTTPSVVNSTIKTYEKGAILAHFNTDRFSGQRSATLTVTIDKPFYAEMQLHIKGYIRSDVDIKPGSVQMGEVDQGTPVDQKVSVNFGSSSQWRIDSIKSGNPYLKAEAVETGRGNGQTNYILKVHLDPKAPVGNINDYLMLVINDDRKTQIPVLVEGRVEAGITVSPAALFMGVVQPGQKVTKPLIVKSKKPFKILAINCDEKSFEFDTSAEQQTSKTVHIIPVTFVAGADMGKVVKTIKIETDQGKFTPELSAYAVVANQ
jgi:hypothetical protein